MNDNPLVSVIVTTYNRKELLKETIDSILNQTYKNFELLVVDNFSDYDFLSHVRSFNDDRIRPFQNENNGIIAVNRNLGIKEAKGENIAFCDDDDLWLPTKLERQLNIIENSNYSIVFTMLKYFGETCLLSDRFVFTPFPFGIDTTFEGLLKKNVIALSSVIVRKKLLNDIGGFSEDKKLIAIEDWELWLRASKVSKIKFLPKILVLYRVGQHNISKFNKNEKEGYLQIGNIHGKGNFHKRINRRQKNKMLLIGKNTIKYLIMPFYK